MKEQERRLEEEEKQALLNAKFKEREFQSAEDARKAKESKMTPGEKALQNRQLKNEDIYEAEEKIPERFDKVKDINNTRHGFTTARVAHKNPGRHVEEPSVSFPEVYKNLDGFEESKQNLKEAGAHMSKEIEYTNMSNPIAKKGKTGGHTH